MRWDGRMHGDEEMSDTGTNSRAGTFGNNVALTAIDTVVTIQV